MTFQQLVDGVRASHLGLGRRPEVISVSHAGEWRQVLKTAGLSRWFLGLDSTPEGVAGWLDDQIGSFCGIPVRLVAPEGGAVEQVYPPKPKALPPAGGSTVPDAAA